MPSRSALTTQHESLRELTDLGVALWLDDLDRNRLRSGELADLINHWSVRGVTTNPTIFHKAISNGRMYRDEITAMKDHGMSVPDMVWQLMIDDVQGACDLFQPVWRGTAGRDGRVSLEVDPGLAHDTKGTIEQAQQLWQRLNRVNAFIKIPATQAGLPAITACIGSGISVNVTLIFSVHCYEQVIDAYLTGLEQAHRAHLPLDSIQSVASLFVSRVDTVVDQQLESLNSPEARSLLGTAAIANARCAWAAHRATLISERWLALAELGANQQRPLWASTGVKNPNYDPTRYVIDLAVAGSVNTMPEGTLRAVAESGVFRGDQVTDEMAAAAQTLEKLRAVGIDLNATLDALQVQGVSAFQESWVQLLDAVAAS